MNLVKVLDIKLIYRNLIFIYKIYTNSELSEVKETIIFTITSKRMKYQRMNLPKVVKDLSSENYKILLEEIEDDTNTWKDILCSWIGRITIVKMTIPATHSFSEIPIILSVAFFTVLERIV